ncbi:hypothetical protein [Sphaerisporangium fuscum]|uniref:hypothetical protein n=1 Tax=Sphaerisporangium fuscum TaxID=2835868 RepID=UPI001BDC832C|nr:hypothetical protein [Sphaerisporangium fuscum]
MPLAYMDRQGWRPICPLLPVLNQARVVPATVLAGRTPLAPLDRRCCGHKVVGRVGMVSDVRMPAETMSDGMMFFETMSSDVQAQKTRESTTDEVLRASRRGEEQLRHGPRGPRLTR